MQTRGKRKIEEEIERHNAAQPISSVPSTAWPLIAKYATLDSYKNMKLAIPAFRAHANRPSNRNIYTDIFTPIHTESYEDPERIGKIHVETLVHTPVLSKHYGNYINMMPTLEIDSDVANETDTMIKVNKNPYDVHSPYLRRYNLADTSRRREAADLMSPSTKHTNARAIDEHERHLSKERENHRKLKRDE